MKLRLLAVASLFALTGCSIIPPAPNATLVTLGEAALGDAAGSPDSDYATLRSAQAQALFAEVARLCGHTSDGTVPDACIYPTADATPSSNSPAEAMASVRDVFSKIPAESQPRLAVMYAQLAMLSPATTFAATDSPPSGMRDWEQGVLFGLDHAHAYTGEPITSLISAHSEVLAALPAGSTPSPIAFDLSNYPQVSSADTAREFALAIESDSAQRWLIAATENPNDPFALIQAGNAASRYADLARESGLDPMAAEFLQLG